MRQLPNRRLQFGVDPTRHNHLAANRRSRRGLEAGESGDAISGAWSRPTTRSGLRVNPARIDDRARAGAQAANCKHRVPSRSNEPQHMTLLAKSFKYQGKFVFLRLDLRPIAWDIWNTGRPADSHKSAPGSTAVGRFAISGFPL